MKYIRLLALAGLLMFTFVACQDQGGAKIARYEDLIRAIIASCGERTVFLPYWWADVPDSASIQMDPIGGYILLYWIDADGNVCHGDPGVNGQPGPFAVRAFHEAAFTAGTDRAAIPTSQLGQLQVIPYGLGSYSSGGFHFAQFDNVIWRVRDSADDLAGQAFTDRASLRLSIPEIVSLDVEFCLVPIYAHDRPDCPQIGSIPLPSLSIMEDEPAQHPEMCNTRLMPDSISLTLAERLGYCAQALPHGLEIKEDD